MKIAGYKRGLYNYYMVKLVNTRITRLLLAFCLGNCMMLPSGAWGQNTFHGFAAIGLQTGRSFLSGHYSDSLNDGISAGFFSFIPYNHFILLNSQLHYSRYALSRSPSSAMHTYSLNFMPSLYFSLPYNFTIYGGSGLSVQHHTIAALKTNAHDSATKAGWLLSIGVARPLFPRTLIMIEWVYNASELSHRTLHTLNTSIKFGYQFALHPPEYYITKQQRFETQKAQQIQELYEAAASYLRQKQHDKALQLYESIVSMNPHEARARQSINIIKDAVLGFNHAASLQKQNRDLESLPYLISSSEYMREAELSLLKTRTRLKPNIADMLNRGITQFNNDDYDGCIAAMDAVLLIDPDNAQARAYKVRAQRIKDTIKKFQ